MKVKLTRNDLYAMDMPIIKTRYCETQTLLKYHDPLAYNSGIYGWNYDIWIIEHAIVVSGYNTTITGTQAKHARAYEPVARAIEARTAGLNYEERRDEIQSLLLEWIKLELDC